MTANMTTAGFRLSMAQERVWRRGEESDAASTRCVVTFAAAPDPARLRHALSAVVASQEVLRTVFQRQAGLTLPFQVILESSEPVWRETPAAGVEELLAREVAFDLAEGPLVYAELARLPGGAFALLLATPALTNDPRGLRNLALALERAYAGEPANEESLQYADIVQWQADMLESEEARAGVEYWRGVVRDEVPLVLPGVKPGGEFRLASLPVTLPEGTAAALEALAAGLAVTPENILLACWAAVVGGLGVQTQVTVAYELEGRKYEELESAVGLFATSVPMRFAVDPALSFAVLAGQIAQQMDRAQQWQECFTWDPEGTPGETLAFAARTPPGTGTGFRIAAELAWREPYLAELVALRGDGALRVELHHDSSRLERPERLAGYFAAMLAGVLAAPGTAVGAVPLLAGAERQQVLVDWNATAQDYPATTVPAMFAAQAARTPDRPAVCFAGQTLTYRELNAQANQLAHFLASAGVGPGSLAGLCVERSTGLMVALLAILKAGAAYVALSPDNPPARLSQQLQEARVLITEEGLLDRMPALAGVRMIVLDRDGAEWAEQPETNPGVVIAPESLAYVLHTSGSTGVPKGVMVRHANLSNYTQYVTQWLGLDAEPEGLRFASVSTIAADLGNTCVFPALTSGGCLHLIAQDTATDAQAMARAMQAERIDVLKIVPSHLEALLHAPEGGQVLPLRYLILGGEALTVRLLRALDALHPVCRIRNHYGPTETTVGALTLRLEDFDWRHWTGAAIPIGRPIANTQAYVLNGQGQPVPVGVAGELYLGGRGVTAGYLGLPEATADRFLADPFCVDPGARMYRTGDRARLLEDGLVEFLGREDDQIKIRGFRVELGEIEAALLACDGVRQAVVQVHDAGLVAYVVAAEHVQPDALRAHVRQQVPEYMVPAHVMLLPRLPLTANGKLDRAALPEPSADGDTYAAPRTPAEEVIAGIWADVLKRERVGTADNFFALGGHSLLATQVISRIRRVLDVDLPLRLLFDEPTVAGLARYAEQGRRDPGTAARPAMQVVSRAGDLPLSFPQQRLWVLDQMEPHNPLYNIPRRMRLRGVLDRAALERALNAVVARHESQRTTFAVRHGVPLQVIAAELTLPLRLVPLAALPEATRMAEARRLALEEAYTPFDLAAGPLLRATLLELAPDDHVLLLTAHHIVSDAWSAGIFFEELDAFYTAFTDGRQANLPPLAFQYADYAAWQRAWLQGDVLERQLAYWRKALEGAPPVLELRGDRPRPAAQTFHGAHQAIDFSAATSALLRQFSREESVSLFMVLLAGFNVLLSRFSGQEQIVVGTDLANRGTVDTERMLGFFINLLALRTDLSGNPPFRELLGRVRSMALDAYARQEIPFDKLVEELQPERSLSHTPLVQVLFVMQNIPRRKRTLGGLALEAFELPLLRAKFDVAVFMADTDEGLVGNWVYSTDLFDAGTIALWAGYLETLLAHAAAAPLTRLAALEMYSEEQLFAREEEKKRKKDSGLKRLSAAAPKAVVLTGD